MSGTLTKEEIREMIRREVRNIGKGPTMNIHGSRITEADVERISRKNDKHLRGVDGIKRQGDNFSLDDPNKIGGAQKKAVPHPKGVLANGVASVVVGTVATGALALANSGTARNVILDLHVPSVGGALPEAPDTDTSHYYVRDGNPSPNHAWVDIYYLVTFWLDYHEFVEDLEAAFSVADLTTMQSDIAALKAALDGGTGGQALQKNSNTDFDFIWV